MLVVLASLLVQPVAKKPERACPVILDERKDKKLEGRPRIVLFSIKHSFLLFSYENILFDLLFKIILIFRRFSEVTDFFCEVSKLYL